MPELPDITIYLEALETRIVGERLLRARITSPFLLRTVSPAPGDLEGHMVKSLSRIGKRIAIGFDDGSWAVFHLMIAGRLHWKEQWPARPSRRILALFAFESGVLELTEAGTKKRASLHLVTGEEALHDLDPGGLELASLTAREFAKALRRRNHSLKRALTDPRILSGIGNAYSDEILHRAGLSPVKWTERLEDEEIERLFEAVQSTIREWTDRLRSEASGGFPEKVTAFRKGMAVHGRYGEPCPVCGTRIQRIRYASNETNYCPRCQTSGKLLADRSLSRLLKRDWPKTIDELEGRQARAPQ